MSKIEDYFININPKQIHADKIYISDGNVLVKKELLHNELLKNYVTQPDTNLMNYIPYDRGEDYELPNNVFLYPKHKLYFEVDKVNLVDYDYIKLFMESYEDVNFTKIDFEINGFKSKAIKVWRGDKFCGCIACAWSENRPNADCYFDYYIEDIYEFDDEDDEEG